MKMSSSSRILIFTFLIGLFCGIILMLLVGCVPAPEPNNPAYAPAVVNLSSGDFTITEINAPGIYLGFRIEDSKHDTVCYMTRGGAGGIFCFDKSVK